MNRKTILISALISAIVAMFTAAAVFVVLFKQSGGAILVDPPEAFAEKSPPPPVKKIDPTPLPAEEIEASDVESVTIDTEYKNFFAAGDKCRQTYNEYFGNSDGYASAGSPCSVRLTVTRDGSAEKTIEISRYDRAAKRSRVVEKTVSKAKLSEAQFNDLANLIVNNQAFKNWSDGVSIYTSNCKIIVRHKNGTKSPMSNVDESATAYAPMVNAFKDLDAKASWKKED